MFARNKIVTGKIYIVFGNFFISNTLIIIKEGIRISEFILSKSKNDDAVISHPKERKIDLKLSKIITKAIR